MDYNTIYQAMRDWLCDCYQEEHDQELINEMSNTQLTHAINRLYDGGVKSFLQVMEA